MLLKLIYFIQQRIATKLYILGRDSLMYTKFRVVSLAFVAYGESRKWGILSFCVPGGSELTAKEKKNHKSPGIFLGGGEWGEGNK